MKSVTFFGEVQGGRILTGTPLTDFEGKLVYVTLIAPDMQTATVAVETQSTGSPVWPRPSEEAEIFEDAGRIRVPARDLTTVDINLVEVGRLPMRVYSSDLED